MKRKRNRNPMQQTHVAGHASSSSPICMPLSSPKEQRQPSTPAKSPVQQNVGVVGEESPRRRLSPRLLAKHASTATSAICTPLRLPKLERPASTPPKVPVQVNLGVVDEEESVPNSLNKRPHKRQDVRKDMAASELHEGLGPSNVEEEEKEVGNVEEEEKEVVWTHLLPYVEVKLPDGRLIRQCRASDVCPLSESFIEKRKRMEDHLREKHGLIIKIPKRQVGRPTNQQNSLSPKLQFIASTCKDLEKASTEKGSRQGKKV